LFFKLLCWLLPLLLLALLDSLQHRNHRFAAAAGSAVLVLALPSFK
jgi:hypothetical protein